MTFEVVATVKMQVESKDKDNARFKAACFLAASNITYGNGDVKVTETEVQVDGGHKRTTLVQKDSCVEEVAGEASGPSRGGRISEEADRH